MTASSLKSLKSLANDKQLDNKIKSIISINSHSLKFNYKKEKQARFIYSLQSLGGYTKTSLA